MPTASRMSLRQAIASKLYGNDTFLTGTATGAGSTTTMVDTKLISTMVAADSYVGYWLYIDTTTADAAPAKEARMVSQFDRTTGTVTVDPAFTAIPGTVLVATYELHPVLHPNRIDEAINWALEFGSNEAYAAIADADDEITTSAIYDRDILMEGALYYLKQGWAHDPGLDPNRRAELTEQWQRHHESWKRGLSELVGYRRPTLVTGGS